MPKEVINKETTSLKVRERKQFRFPSGYGDNKIVLLARDPWWIFAYWEILKNNVDTQQKPHILVCNDDGIEGAVQLLLSAAQLLR